MKNEEATATVRFDGETLHPLTPLDLVPDAIYEITIKARHKPESEGTLWELLEELAGTVDGPSDWTTEHDHDFHGTPKREQGPDAIIKRG